MQSRPATSIDDGVKLDARAQSAQLEWARRLVGSKLGEALVFPALQFFFHLVRLLQRSHGGASRRQRAEYDVDVESVEAPPKESRREESHADHVAQRRRERELHR